jgi:hypothetical protein
MTRNFSAITSSVSPGRLGKFNALQQGCQMVYFQTKNPNLGKFWRALKWKMLVYFKVISIILPPFDIVYVYLVKLW